MRDYKILKPVKPMYSKDSPNRFFKHAEIINLFIYANRKSFHTG